MIPVVIPIVAAAFSLQQVMSAPFVDHLTASPDGSVLVWKVYERGRYNIYTNAGGSSHRVTPYTGDDGLDIDDVHILPSNDAVIYARGGVGDNGGGDNINPLSLIPPPARTVYIAPLSGGEPVTVGQGLKGTVSPKGNQVAWIFNGALMMAPLSKTGSAYAVGKNDTLAIRGQVQDLAWSPDGSRIAFTNVRGDHSFVVIYDPSAKKYVYSTPDFSYDSGPVWSPDGTRVAFVRVPGARENENPYLDPPRQPWSIWVADAQNGNAHMAWQARRGMGAQFYMDEGNAQSLWWMTGDRIAFLWEGDGWDHLYAVPASGGQAQRLTTGNFEVEIVSESLDNSKLLYATNEGAIDWRHIWEVGLDAHPQQLTAAAPFNQWSPTPLAKGDLAYISASYNVPPTVMVGVPGKALTADLTPADFPAKDLVQPQLITYKSPDGLTIHAQLFLPRTPGKHPAIVFDHGGPPRQMLAGFHYMDAYSFLYESNQYLVNRGFVVLSINYRSGIMYGHNFRTPKDCCWWGSSEYQDVLAGGRLLQKRPEVAASRIGIYGLSYGGLLTALALARNSDVFKAGADIAGVHNWATIFDHDYGKPVGTAEQRKVAYDASPIANLDTWRSPVLISQGDDDRNVPFSQGVDMVTRLRDKGVHVETLVFPNETHENQVWGDLVARYQAVADFLTRMLH